MYRIEGIGTKFQSNEKQGLTVKLFYPGKISFRIEGQIKSFPDKKMLKEFTVTEPLLYDMLKGLI